MDPIDGIASRFRAYCMSALQVYSEIEFVFKACNTQHDALAMLERMKYTQYLDPLYPEMIQPHVDRYQRALDSLEDTVCLAKKVFIYNYSEGDKNRTFLKEVSFSFACKLLSQYGPLLCHFSGGLAQRQVVLAELELACSTPYLSFNAETDLYCLEAMDESNAFHRFVPSPQSACL